MDHRLKRQDYLTLHYIVQQAHKKYLKQSRIGKQGGFNILRILSAFKQIFPTTPDHLYKLIMVITKKSNPQTLDQWKKGVQQINKIQIKNSQSSINFNNQSSIKQQDSRILSSKLRNPQQDSIKTYKQQLDNQIDYIQSKRSRLKFVGDFRITEPSWMHQHTIIDENKQNIMEYSNKNSLRNSQHAHLISFQPTHKDSIKQNAQKIRSYINTSSNNVNNNNSNNMINKQTINFNQTQKYDNNKKINPYHEITRIDNLSLIQDRDLMSKDESKTLYSQNYRTEENSRRYIPSKTHRDNSIIRAHGLDSKDTDISIKRSEFAQPLKSHQILQYQDFNMTVAQWEGLNQRTTTFYQFNSKLKAFSALLANCQAFQCDRFLKHKADVFHSNYLESKVFIALKDNVQIQQIFKQKLKTAEQHHSQVLNKKVLKVLKVLNNLKIQKTKNKFQVQNLNHINYQFFLSFMFQEKYLYDNSPKKAQNINQSFDFEKKAQYFSKTQNFQNVWNIYKCFGLNISISKEQLTSFFNNYHQCLQRNIFLLLKKNVSNKKDKYFKMHDNRLIEKVFSILLSRKQTSKIYKEKQQIAESISNKQLKQKAYKILLSIVYSTKIFSKRQQFIECKKVQKTKSMTFKKWMSEFRQIQNNKKAQLQRLQAFTSVVKSFILRISFKSIKEESVDVLKKIKYCVKIWQMNIMRKVLKHFSTLIINKKRYISLCETNQIQFQRKMLHKWLNIAKISDGLNKIQRNANKLIYRKMFIPLVKSMVKNYLMNQQSEKNLVKDCFEILRVNKVQSEEKRNLLINQAQKFIFTQYSSQLINVMKLNHSQIMKTRKQEQIQKKVKLLNRIINKSINTQFFIRFKLAHQINISFKQRQSKIKQIIQQNSKCLMIQNCLQIKNLRQNQIKLKKYIKEKYFGGVYYEIKRNQMQNKQNRLKIGLNKKLLVNFKQIVSFKYNIMMRNKQMSQEHIKKSLQRKALYSLAQNFIDINHKSRQLQQMLQRQRKIQYFSVLLSKIKKQRQIKIKQQILQKRQIYPLLRQNLKLKTRQKILQIQLKSNKLQQAIECFQISIQNIQKKKRIQYLQNILKERLFWMRFNNNFINSLFQKKHLFMAYKFRALKLYKLAFNSWKKNTFGDLKSSDLFINKKLSHKQYNINHQNKELFHMHKPTDCS